MVTCEHYITSTAVYVEFVNVTVESCGASNVEEELYLLIQIEREEFIASIGLHVWFDKDVSPQLCCTNVEQEQKASSYGSCRS